MWEKQYEHAQWNGHKLNILSVSIDGGKRLQVSELPYVDLPDIKVMGSKAKKFSFELVFVGSRSLIESNAFLASIEQEPTGTLEHPWLGELSLVYETFSESISTKKGVVILSLGFVAEGKTPTINTRSFVRAKDQGSAVEQISTKLFEQDVRGMDVHEINKTQSQFTESLNVLVDISNRLNVADDALQNITSTINSAVLAVSGLGSSPESFSNTFSQAVAAVADGVQSEPESSSSAVDNARNAQALLLNQVKPDAASSHYNIQMTVAAVKVNKSLANLEKVPAFDMSSALDSSPLIESDLSTLLESLDERVTEATQVSTLESIELYDALIALQGNVQMQKDKFIEGTSAHRWIQSPVFRPALTIAHDEQTRELLLRGMNNLQHPLFFRGDVAIREERS
ncbi:DNA circularization N-terminal domain-containing protein [Vibrio scophthalmi]|uniref:DNA circulation N-terminal domain-containing protein n=1 Tax=Vibrio scophthalmi TaxID=45658 RepID=A0A1E3WJ48_9VIBR|nr:DNA circularization N-terminal domain-containing protein [Vibrio scophthalmi]ODS09755.1 hypothetical protein VSF3289_03217 [Vibrio scophthalmi]